MLALHQKRQKPRERQKDMNACGINRNINNIIVKKRLLIPTIEKKNEMW